MIKERITDLKVCNPDLFQYSYFDSDGSYGVRQQYDHSRRHYLRKISVINKDPFVNDALIQLLSPLKVGTHQHKPIIHRATVFYKQPGCEHSLGWHQDVGLDWDSTKFLPKLQVAWFPLDSIASHNGCLEVLSGSHKLGVIGNGNHLLKTDLTSLLHTFEIDHLFGDIGDVVCFSPLLVHRSGTNPSSSCRAALNILFE